MAKRILFILMLLVSLSLHVVCAKSKQNSSNKEEEIQLTVSSDGATKDEATKNALRSAIEQAYGAFVSANTTILNDELVKDELVTLTNGSIKTYKEIASTPLPNGNYAVTLNATVSLPQLVKYVKSKGSECEFAGNTFGMQIKLFELQKENERKVLDNLKNQISALLQEELSWDLSMEIQYLNNDFYEVIARIYARTIPLNSKKKRSKVGEILINTLNAIKLSEDEANSYEEMGLNIGMAYDPRLRRERYQKKGEYWDVFYFRNPDANKLLENIYWEIGRRCINFVLVDNMGIKHDFISSYLNKNKTNDAVNSLVKYPFSIEPIPDNSLTNKESLFVFKNLPWKKGVFPGLLFPTYYMGEEDHFPLMELTFLIPKSEIGKYSKFVIEYKNQSE